jgi:hypothetical protein
MRIKLLRRCVMAKATKERLLSFSMKDKPGLLSEITTRLSKAKVNISAICAYAWDDTAYFDMTTDSNAKAKKALKELKVEFEEEDVIAVEMQNKVGQLDKVAKTIADAGINIGYMYATTSTGKTSTCLFSTSDNRKALRLINK